MSAPLLQTKLYTPPTRPDIVSRPRLIERLNASLSRKLSLISAPAGFGKTTLLSEWADVCARPVAWLSLDPGDNDPARFLAYLIAALQTLENNLGQGALTALQSPQAPPPEELLIGLINQINALPASASAGAGRDWILILDDYHTISAQPVHQAVKFLLEHLPGNLHLAIATRSDPPLPLARLRAHGQLTELRQSDLRFTPDEVTQFFNQALELDLSSADVTALAGRTEGWIAGLQMAAISLRGRRRTQNGHGVSDFVQAFTGSHRFILDYLMQEVLNQQPDSLQEFLLCTSVLDRLTGPLCDALMDGNGGQSTLNQLEQNNLFLLPLDTERRWYRYHHLFAELLQQRLQQTEPDRVPALHRRASQWYESNQLTDPAIHHALSAQDWERAARLVEEAAQATWMHSQVATFLSWLAQLPDELVRARPRLDIYYATGLLMDGQPLEVVQARLQEISQSAAADAISGEITLLQSMIAAYQGETEQSAALSRQALQTLPPDSLFLRSLAAGLYGLAQLYGGEIKAATQALNEALKISQQVGNRLNAVLALSHLAELALLQGRLHQAQGLYQQALDQATDDRGRALPIAGLALIGLGQLAYEWDELETAEQQISQGIELIKQAQKPGAIRGYIYLARLKQARGDKTGAHEAMQRAQRLANQFDAMDADDVLVALNQVHLWLIQGNLPAAAHWAQERDPQTGVSPEVEGGSWFSLLQELEHMVLARVYLAQKRPNEALQVLDPLLQTVETRKQTWVVIMVLALRGLALQAMGHTDQALNALERALALAEPESLVRTFVDEGPNMAELLRHAASQGITPGYVSQLLAAFDTFDEPALAPASSQPLIDPLSEREMEVMHLLATHLSSPEIAKKLFISVNTVRSHIKSIYSKLNVHSRLQAIERAHELGLL